MQRMLFFLKVNKGTVSRVDSLDLNTPIFPLTPPVTIGLHGLYHSAERAAACGGQGGSAPGPAPMPPENGLQMRIGPL